MKKNTFKYETDDGKYYMIESLLFRTGDEVVHVHDDSLDILTILEVTDREAVCFEYNPRHSFIVALTDIEPLCSRGREVLDV